MTNVPPEIRQMWTDLYKLFDRHYLMDGSDEAWLAFHSEAKELWEKFDQNSRVGDGIVLIADWIGDRLRAVRNAQCTGQMGEAYELQTN